MERVRHSAPDDFVESSDTQEQSALAQRLQGGAKPTVWSEFGALASSLGDSVVNLGQGFPDFAPPDFVRVAAYTAISKDCHQYTRPAGHPPLVNLLAERYSSHLGRPVDSMSEIAVTVGCSQALYVSMQCLVRPGDEVVLFEPFFDLYLGQIRMAGGTPRFVPLKPCHDDGSSSAWALDVAALEAAIGPKTCALVLNSPHNPTGKVFTPAEMHAIAAVVSKWPRVVVVSDEVYKYTVHGTGHDSNDGLSPVNPEHQSVNSDAAGHLHFASLPGMFDRTLTLSSAGKTFAVTGWQVGWIVGPARLLSDVQTALPFLQFCASTPMQQALVEVLRQADQPYGGFDNYYLWLSALYKRKAALLSRALEAAHLPILNSEGGYFLTVDVSDVNVPQRYLDEKSPAIETVTKDWAFCRWLAEEHGVLAIPVAPFFSLESRSKVGNFARFAFCKTDATLEKAAERLRGLSPIPAEGDARTSSSSSSLPPPPPLTQGGRQQSKEPERVGSGRRPLLRQLEN